MNDSYVFILNQEMERKLNYRDQQFNKLLQALILKQTQTNHR